MVGTMKYFSITTEFVSQINWILLLLAFNMAAVQTLYWMKTHEILENCGWSGRKGEDLWGRPCLRHKILKMIPWRVERPYAVYEIYGSDPPGQLPSLLQMILKFRSYTVVFLPAPWLLLNGSHLDGMAWKLPQRWWGRGGWRVNTWNISNLKFLLATY